MNLDEYQERANQTDQRPGRDEAALAFPLMGLASEVGSLLNQYKKRVRDGEAHALFFGPRRRRARRHYVVRRESDRETRSVVE